MSNATLVNSIKTLESMNVDSGLLREAWASQVVLESLLVDPLVNAPMLSEAVGPGNDGQKLPEKIFINITQGTSDTKGVRDIVKSFLKSLSGTGKFGRDTSDQAGSEEQLVLKYCKFYANDWSHAVAAETFGIDFRELSPYQIFEKAKPLLAQWLGEKSGQFCREALCTTRSSNLTKAPTSLTQPINPNVYIVGATDPTPSYSGLIDTYENNVSTALNPANCASPGTNSHFTIAKFLDLIDHAADTYIRTIPVAGKDIYVMWLCADEYRRMLDPAITASWAAFYTSVGSNSDLAAQVPGAIGMIAESLVLCRDRRAPTAINGSGDVTFGYMAPGRSDGRTSARTANVSWNVNLLLGQGAVGKFEPENAHYEEQKDRYGKNKGVGMFGAFAWQICQWDTDALGTSSDSSTQQEGSILVFTSRKLT